MMCQSCGHAQREAAGGPSILGGSYLGLTRQKTELTLVISTVQLRLVVMVCEWDSAFSDMVAKTTAVDRERESTQINSNVTCGWFRKSPWSLMGTNDQCETRHNREQQRSLQHTIQRPEASLIGDYNRLQSTTVTTTCCFFLKWLNNAYLSEGKCTYFALCDTRDGRASSENGSGFGLETCVKSRLPPQVQTHLKQKVCQWVSMYVCVCVCGWMRD